MLVCVIHSNLLISIVLISSTCIQHMTIASIKIWLERFGQNLLKLKLNANRFSMFPFSILDCSVIKSQQTIRRYFHCTTFSPVQTHTVENSNLWTPGIHKLRVLPLVACLPPAATYISPRRVRRGYFSRATFADRGWQAESIRIQRTV